MTATANIVERAEYRPDSDKRLGYRPDIDGLRAIAVAAVIAYHAAPRVVPGGFVGVDVFFVVSGFLITSLILNGLAADRFSVVTFLSYRVRRIWPALVVVLATTLLVGSVGLFPDEFAQLGRDVLAGGTFTTNLVLFHVRSGYFDVRESFRPLLHLWSLGIEEQFYIVWPLVLLAAWKRRWSLPWMIAGLALVSFASGVAIADRHNEADFYLPMWRGWELLLGAALAVKGVPPLRRYASSVGMTLIGIAVFTFSRRLAYPGAWALAPTIGTALVILGGRDAWLNRVVLSKRPMVYVGLISYPLYLWHWPALVLVRLTHARPSAAILGAAIVASVILAIATYHLVEMPIRTKGVKQVRVPLLAALAIVCVAAIPAQRGLWRARNSTQTQLVAAMNDRWAFPGRGRVDSVSRDLEIVSLGASAPRRTVLFVGDSHVQQYWPRVEQIEHALDSAGVRVLFATKAGCLPLPQTDRVWRRYGCADFFDAAMRRALAGDVSTVVFGGYWDGILNNAPGDERGIYWTGDARRRILTPGESNLDSVFARFASAATKLESRGVQVEIILSSPAGPELDPRQMLTRLTHRAISERGLDARAYRASVAGIEQKLIATVTGAGARVIDPIGMVCSPEWCASRAPTGEPLYRDEDHMRSILSRQIAVVDSAIRR